MLKYLLGRWRVRVAPGQHPHNPVSAVVMIDVPKNWFNHNVYVVDMITFLLMTEQIVEHADLSKQYEFTNPDGNKIVIPAYLVRSAQVEFSKAGPNVYKLMKQIDGLMDQLAERALQSDALSEQAKKQLREREPMMSIYIRERAKLKGESEGMIAVSGSDTVH